MTRPLRRISFLIIAAGALGFAYYYLSREDPVEVLVTPAGHGTVENTVANTRAGTVKACRRARMAPPTGGQIARLAVREGARVEAGDILLELWNEDLTARLALARSEAKASRDSAEQACLIADEAERTAQRQVDLKKKGLASEENVDQALTRAKASRASCNAARARAEVSRAQITVARAELERTQLKAPFEGTVAEVNGEIGEFVTPSPTGIAIPPAVDLIDDSCLYISAPIDEVDAPAIRAGMDARIVLDAFQDRSFPGIVQRIAPYVLEVEKQARTVDVEAVFANPEDFRPMLPGYSADLEVIIDRHEDVVRIPTEALLEGGRVFIYLPDEQRLVERRVETGLSNWEYTEITTGLRDGELVVTSVDREGVTDGALARAEASSAGP